MSGPLRRVAAPAVVLVAVALLGGCGGRTDDAAPTTTSQLAGSGGADDDAATTTTIGVPPGQDSTFCASLRGIQDLGAGTAAAGGPPEVLAQNEQLLDLLDEATANVPDGAPADVESLFDDYRAVAAAISAAGGDVDAAYRALEADDPQLAGRLVAESAHLPAFEFFATHCGLRLQ